jgi:hypothetical protein
VPVPTLLRILIPFQALVWLINGLFCKVLQLEPRHEAIVARILGPAHAPLLTTLIGLSEILLSIWIASCIRPRFAIAIQILLIAAMNLLEVALASDLLLFGWGNAVVAAAYIAFLQYYGRRIGVIQDIT